MRHILICTLICLTTPAYAGVWCDDFNNLSNRWLQHGNADWKVIDGKLNAIHNKDDGGAYMVIGLDSDWSSHTVKCDVKFIEETDPNFTGQVCLGIHYRTWNEIINCIDLSFYADGDSAFKVYFKQITTIIESRKTIPPEPGSFTELKIIAVGGFVAAYINGQRVLQVINNEFTGLPLTGGVGLGISLAEAAFDNVYINREGVETNCRTVTPTSKTKTTFATLKHTSFARGKQ